MSPCFSRYWSLIQCCSSNRVVIEVKVLQIHDMDFSHFVCNDFIPDVNPTVFSHEPEYAKIKQTCDWYAMSKDNVDGEIYTSVLSQSFNKTAWLLSFLRIASSAVL